MDLEFRNLTYTVHSRIARGPGKQVIKGVSGRFMAGQLIAIMGPSGAGKSSLLNVISGYKSGGITGELLVDGQTRDEQQFKRSSCYITQEDLLQPLLTVREAMDVAAKFKLPKGAKIPSEEILQELGLLEHQNTKTDLLSGGQKKRLAIALELVNNPPVFFLDEPTSGLDNVTTVQCIKLLKQLARQGRTVVCTIHQPPASLFELFDQAYILADGRCIYQGDTDAMVPHLQSVGLACPRHHNPADFIIEVTENSQNITMLCDEILNGKMYKSAKFDTVPSEPINNMHLKVCYQIEDESGETEIVLSNEKCTYQVKQYNEVSNSTTSLDQMSRDDSSLAWMKIQKSTCRYPTTNFQQFSILLVRMLVQISRNHQALWIQTVHHVMCGVLVGLCFFGTANDGSQMFNHLKMCVGLVIFFAYTQIMVPVLVYPQENGCAIGPAAIAPFLGLAIYGFDFAHRIPLIMNIIMKTSFIRCGVVAMILTVFGFGRKNLDCKDTYCHFAKPDVLLRYLDIENSSVWFEILIMVSIMVTARFLCYMGLRWRFTT
ncbi:jg24448 [Pararge aegeria aegeria]|uniref:Jg24448 protein n=1 Tax=Pararge aegeria aegeria TaxID=348720 RepID=A0A8S4RKI6_9NEOP|nr:jg24448 [Pararge aegeria aegeria]